MKNVLLLLATVALFTGCSTTANPTFTSTGKPGYRLVCGGAFGNGELGGCYEKAGELCSNLGYRVIQTSVSSMIIECRDSQDQNAATPVVQ